MVWACAYSMRLQIVFVFFVQVHTLESSPLQSSWKTSIKSASIARWLEVGLEVWACAYSVRLQIVYMFFTCTLLNQVPSIKLEDCNQVCINCKMVGGWAGGLGMRLQRASTDCVCFCFVHVHTLESSPFNQIGRFQSSLHQLQDGWRLGWWFGHAPTACIILYCLCSFTSYEVHSISLKSSLPKFSV